MATVNRASVRVVVRYFRFPRWRGSRTYFFSNVGQAIDFVMWHGVMDPLPNGADFCDFLILFRDLAFYSPYANWQWNIAFQAAGIQGMLPA